MRAAVIGSQGFLGRATTLALRRSNAIVAEFTRARSPFDDPSRSVARLADADVVFYMASSVNPKIAEERPDLVARDHQFFRRILDVVVESTRPVTVVLPSSGGTVYDPQVAPPYREQSPVSPSGAYASSRLELETMLQAAAGAAVRPAVCRISNAFGPGQRVGTGQGVIGHWLHAARTHEPIRLFGDARQRRDFIYVDDVVDALIGVACSDDPPAVVNIGSGVPTTLGELADALVQVVDRDAVTVVREPARPFDRHDTWLDVTLAQRALGWHASVPLAEGLRRTWATLSDPSDSTCTPQVVATPNAQSF